VLTCAGTVEVDIPLVEDVVVKLLEGMLGEAGTVPPPPLPAFLCHWGMWKCDWRQAVRLHHALHWQQQMQRASAVWSAQRAWNKLAAVLCAMDWAPLPGHRLACALHWVLGVRWGLMPDLLLAVFGYMTAP
jgi:hypothetical protein